MTSLVPNPDPLPQLAQPGERLGWIFNDRNLYRRKFTEPPPEPGRVPPELQDRWDRALRGRGRRIAIVLGSGVGLAVLIGCCGGALSMFGEDDGRSTLAPVLVFAVIALIGGVA